MKRKIIEKLFRMRNYYKENGLFRFLRHVVYKILHLDEMTYSRWRKKHRLTKEEIEKQKKEVFQKQPRISILIPLYCTPQNYLENLVNSIRNQTYDNWELCFSDGSGNGKMDHTYLKECMRKDKRIKLIVAEKPLSISENTNQALTLATGEYLAFADHDDILAENALYECVKVINEQSNVDIIYSDEDKVSMDGKVYFQPHFKSDFNIDLLRSMNYICHLFVVKKEIQQRVGLLREEYDGAQDYDFILRCVEQSEQIYHIPKILYHWRAHLQSTAENPESKLYAFEAGKRAIEAHLKRCGLKANVEMGPYLGLYRVKYYVEKEPLISVLIPNKDHQGDLERCIQSLYEIDGYSNVEIIIIENGSSQEKTFRYYEQLQAQKENIKVLEWKEKSEFNYSALNNFAVKEAHGKYLLFLNNDTEFMYEGCLKEMVSYAEREDVGAVGAKLYYPDGTIQHAGVILGIGGVPGTKGIAGHAFREASHNANGYFSRIICAQNYSAVTAACMMMRKTLFDEVGGFDEKLKVAFNDIDLCMKIRQQDKLVVYTPYAELIHYESKSRGGEDTREKIERFNQEVQYFVSKWQRVLDKGDPYYNPNLTLEKHDFSLKIV